MQSSLFSLEPMLMPWSFPSFLQTFEAVVLSNHSLTDFQRLHYLRSCLQGEALDSIESIVPREGCYLKAVERQQSIYKGDSQQMAALIRQKIHGKKRLPEDCGIQVELKTIREFRTLVEQLLTSEIDNAFLTDAIVTRLPERVIKKAVKMRMESPIIGTISLLEKLETASLKDQTVQKLTQVTKKGLKKENIFISTDTDEPRDCSDNEEEEKSETSVTAIFPNSPNIFTGEKNKKCAFCGNHSSGQEEKCKMFSNPEERASRCRMLRLCFRCLIGGSNHNFQRCEATCAHCGGSHHRALCKKLLNSKNRTVGNQRNGVAACMDEEDVEKDDDYFNKYHNEMERLLEIGDTALTLKEFVGAALPVSIPRLPRIASAKLFTFAAGLVHPKTGTIHRVNVLLDPGASVSLISDRIVRILQMDCIGAAETAFSGVGGQETEFRQYKIHSFTLKTRVKDSVPLEVEAYEFPAPLTGLDRQFGFSSKDRRFIKKERLETAVLNDPDGPPDVLVSLQRSTEVMNTGQKFLTLPSGMRLFPTSLGYVRIGSPTPIEKDGIRCLYPDSMNMIDQSPMDESGMMKEEEKLSGGHLKKSRRRALFRAVSPFSLIMIGCILAMIIPLGATGYPLNRVNEKSSLALNIPEMSPLIFPTGYSHHCFCARDDHDRFPSIHRVELGRSLSSRVSVSSLRLISIVYSSSSPGSVED